MPSTILRTVFEAHIHWEILHMVLQTILRMCGDSCNNSTIHPFLGYINGYPQDRQSLENPEARIGVQESICTYSLACLLEFSISCTSKLMKETIAYRREHMLTSPTISSHLGSWIEQVNIECLLNNLYSFVSLLAQK